MAVEGVDRALLRIDLPAGTNLADLGPEADLRDATAIVDIVCVAHRHKTAIRAGFIRRMVDDVWQTKRLFALPGGYAYDHGIYRRALPWSAAAVDRARGTQRVSRGLILQHVIPVGLTLALVESASSPEQVVEVLRRDLVLAVITKRAAVLTTSASTAFTRIRHNLGRDTRPHESQCFLTTRKSAIRRIPLKVRTAGLRR